LKAGGTADIDFAPSGGPRLQFHNLASFEDFLVKLKSALQTPPIYAVALQHVDSA